MAEHDDPIRLLENFGTGGVDVSPLDPAQVRRLGDRRRTRRRAAYVAASVTAVVVAIVPVALTAGRGGNPEPGPLTTGSAPVITYPGAGVQVHDATQTDLLRGAPADFKAFVGRLAGQLKVESDSLCGRSDYGVTVKKVTDDGYALGAVKGCGGYDVLWVRSDGQWKEALGTEDQWRCGDLARFGIPQSFAGECFTPGPSFGPTEDLGLRLGMSREQVLAAGGTVTGPAGACQGVTPHGLKPQKNSTLGALSAIPGKGVVELVAQDDQVTPEGISVGSSKADVQKAYPNGHFDEMKGAWVVPIDGHSHYRFDLNHDWVVLVSLEAEGPQDCYE